MIYNNVSLFYHNIIVYFEFYFSKFEKSYLEQAQNSWNKVEHGTKWNTFTGFHIIVLVHNSIFSSNMFTQLEEPHEQIFYNS